MRPLLEKLPKKEFSTGVEVLNVETMTNPEKARERKGFVLSPGGRAGKYQLVEKLGQGSFGSVFKARDTELDREVAFKVLNPAQQSNSDVVTRFLQEARATARIKHPGIVTVLDSGRIPTEIGELGYLVMELLEGESLIKCILREKQLEPEFAVEICQQIASALDAAHRADVLHRDLKPDNVFLVPDPLVASGVRVKVFDFGLAKLGRGGNTMINTILGTPRYMSPEQCRSSAKIDARSDVYALGCILFELLTGRTPFDGDLKRLVEQHQFATPPSVRSLVKNIDISIDKLVSRMLAKEPAGRPQTMAEVHAALGNAIAPLKLADESAGAERARKRRRSSAPPPLAHGEPPTDPSGPIKVETTAVSFPPPPPEEPRDATEIVAPLPAHSVHRSPTRWWWPLGITVVAALCFIIFAFRATGVRTPRPAVPPRPAADQPAVSPQAPPVIPEQRTPRSSEIPAAAAAAPAAAPAPALELAPEPAPAVAESPLSPSSNETAAGAEARKPRDPDKSKAKSAAKKKASKPQQYDPDSLFLKK